MRSRTIKLSVLGFGLMIALVGWYFLKARADNEEDAFGNRPAFNAGAFDVHLRKIGQISPQEFARMFPLQEQYRDKLSFDPTTAKFWKEFERRYQFSQEERDVFKKQGFVVSERLGDDSFAGSYYRIFSADLPVFISADSILHAWHRSYDAMLEELEECYLSILLDEILTGMADEVKAARRKVGDGVLAQSVLDADYYLAVARSLLSGKAVKSKLDQDARVAESIQACDRLQAQEFKLFGRYRAIDFSQFKVRGHYENSEQLKRYFRAMMWCGRIEMRVAGGKDENGTASSPEELGSAIVLNDLLKRAKKFGQWGDFDRMIQTFVGRTDSMTFSQLNALLKQGGINAPSDVKNLDTLTSLQTDILAGKLGLQQIRSDLVTSSPDGPDKAELPRSFTFLGQKFVVDSWATSKIVADDVMWDDRKVQRRIPSALDVAFAVLANDQVVPNLVERMENPNGRKFRDGLNYQHNLAAVRRTIDGQDPVMWDETLYTNWLATLRELSKPTTGKEYPEVMQSRAWAMKTLNTQLGSWSQLRHDTILYAKQSYSSGTLCEYPAGFVEPVPHFWERLEKMANKAAELIEKTPYPNRAVEMSPQEGKPIEGSGKVNLRLKEVQKKQVVFFRDFAKQVAFLKSIAVKQLAQKELTADEGRSLKDVVQIHGGGSGGPPRFDGWYPKLFYKGPLDSGKWDALVADIHSNPPDPNLGDPGCVLTQGVRNVDLLLVAIDNGKDRMVYAGPLFSHYEFEMPGLTRMSDSEWKQLGGDKIPPRPEWTKTYLVPNRHK